MMIKVFNEMDNQIGLQVVYERLIKILHQKGYYNEAIFFTKLLINLQQKQVEELDNNKGEISHDKIKKINLKIFYNLKKILSLLIKNLKVNKKSQSRQIYGESLYILKEIVDYSDKLNIQEFLNTQLIIKKSKVQLYLRKIKESEKSINYADEIL